MPVFAAYRPNPGIDEDDNYGTSVEDRVDAYYYWLYANSIIYELLCIILVMRRLIM